MQQFNYTVIIGKKSKDLGGRLQIMGKMGVMIQERSAPSIYPPTNPSIHPFPDQVNDDSGLKTQREKGDE
jgi:hypothetical protein